MYLKNLITLFVAISPFLVVAKPKEIKIFDGKTTKGWHVLNGTAEYRIENGEIIGISKAGSPNTFLVTDNNYTNFVLEYDMRIDEGLNSGVQIRSQSVSSINNGRVFGPQIECEDTQRGWAGGVYDEGRKGWRYPMEYNPKAKTAFKKSEWNHFKVIAFDNHFVTWVNGIATANLLEESVETGFIGLQVHAIGSDKGKEGKEIRWKNIKLSSLTSKDFAKIGKTTAPQVSYLTNTLTKEQIADGWKLLWDGKTSAGWRGAKLDHFPTSGWKMGDGILEVLASNGGESTNGGDIVTIKKYKNFILELDFQITQGANSGIKYFVDTELNKGAGSSIGCEFQILDDQNHPDAKLGKDGNRTMGSLYDLIRANGKTFNPYLPTEKYVNGIGNWNRACVVVEGNKVKHILNGIKVVEYERGTADWRKLVAGSKYKDWPKFGEAESGNILLQDHGNNVRFKNIKIKEL